MFDFILVGISQCSLNNTLGIELRDNKTSIASMAVLPAGNEIY